MAWIMPTSNLRLPLSAYLIMVDSYLRYARCEPGIWHALCMARLKFRRAKTVPSRSRGIRPSCRRGPQEGACESELVSFRATLRIDIEES